MTPEAQRIAIAEACGTHNRWMLMKRGLYYRPKAQGYTNCISEAWIVSEEEADRHAYPHDQPVTKHRAPLPNYLSDLNAIHEAEKLLSAEQQIVYQETLTSLVASHRHWKHVTFDLLHATAAQRCEAFLRTLYLWRDDALVLQPQPSTPTPP